MFGLGWLKFAARIISNSGGKSIGIHTENKHIKGKGRDECSFTIRGPRCKSDMMHQMRMIDLG